MLSAIQQKAPKQRTLDDVWSARRIPTRENTGLELGLKAVVVAYLPDCNERDTTLGFFTGNESEWSKTLKNKKAKACPGHPVSSSIEAKFSE